MPSPKRDNVTSIFAAKMMELFEGFGTAHGTHDEPTRRPDSLKWEIKTTAQTLKIPVSVELWKEHLDGRRPLGIIAVREDSRCRWGSIDYDVYDADIVRILKKVSDMKLPLVPCRSKSGGLHLFCFTSEFVPAVSMQTVLRDLSARLGIAGSEVYPKQTQILVERGDLGSWMIMPYFGDNFGGKLREQVGLKKNGNEMTIQEFMRAAGDASVTESDLADLTRKRPTRPVATYDGDDRKVAIPGVEYPEPDRPFGDGPPCLEQLAEEKVQRGQQNNALFNMGVYAKGRYPDEWQARLEKMAQEHLEPPGRAEATSGLIKSLEKKDYRYTCHQEPIHSYCNPSLCRLRPFGVGKAGDVPDLRGMSVMKTDPPLWFMSVEEKRVELTTEELLSYQKFIVAVAMQAHKSFAPMKQADWQMYVKGAIEDAEPISVPESAGERGGILELFDEYVTERRDSSTMEGLIGGMPWYDKNEDVYWFRLKGFVDFMRTQGVREFGRNKLVSLLKAKFDMKSTTLRIRDKFWGVWGIDGKLIEKRSGSLKTPTQEEEGI